MKMGVIGCGVMANILATQIKMADLNIEIYTYNPTYEKAINLARLVDGIPCREIADLPPLDIYFLSCKPQNIQDVATKLSPFLSKGSTLISILAGIKTGLLEDLFSCKSIMRIMPNTPNSIGKGINLFFSTIRMPNIHKDYMFKLFNTFSKIIELKVENDFDSLTLISGSGPAYILEFVRILSLWIEKKGVDYLDAEALVADTFIGSLELLQRSDLKAQDLRDKVVSKNGITHEVLKEFKRSQLEQLLFRSLDLGLDRGKELGSS